MKNWWEEDEEFDFSGKGEDLFEAEKSSNDKSFEEVFGTSFDEMPLRQQIETAYDYYDKPQNGQAYQMAGEPVAFGGEMKEDNPQNKNAIDYSLYGDGFDKEFIDKMENDQRFQNIMKNRTQKNEGGYVNHPLDKGGATNYGISSRFYPNEDILNMTPERAKAILYRDYWLAPKINLLPDEYADIVFDDGVVQGQATAIRNLQKALGVRPDGLIGPNTLDKVSRADSRVRQNFIRNVHDVEDEYLRKNPSQKIFERGHRTRFNRY